MNFKKFAALIALALTAIAATAQPVDLVAQRDSKSWEIRRDETTLMAALMRWSKEAGYEDFVWSAGREVPARPLSHYGTFRDALRQVMSDSALTGYPVRACLYRNNLVRIVRSTELCKPAQ